MKKRTKLLIGSIISIVLVYTAASFIAIFITLPFVGPLWHTNGFFRYSMRQDVSQRVIGLHQDDVVAMLGEPNTDPHYSSPQAWIYNIGLSWGYGGAIIIFFDDSGIAEEVVVANPIHILGG